MCGRFALDYPSPYLADWYRVGSLLDLFPRYNIAPMTNILVIRERENGREGSIMRWGLIPHWAISTKNIPLLSNARAETVASKPVFKNSFRRRRCIIPATGFYEWRWMRNGNYKQPYFLSTNDAALPPLLGFGTQLR